MRAFLVVVLAALFSAPAHAGAPDAALLTLAFSANSYGYVKPCPS